MAGRSPPSKRRRRAGEAELAAWSGRRFTTSAPLAALMASQLRSRRSANLTAVRAYVTRFEVTHGVTSANWADAVIDVGGMPVSITETDDYTILSGLYALLAGIADSHVDGNTEAPRDLHRR